MTSERPPSLPNVERRPPAVAAEVAARLTGLPIVGAQPLVGGRENTTQVVWVEGRGRLLLQQLRTRTGARHRIALADRVPRAAARAGVPVPTLVASDPTADPAWFLRRFVEARSATATLRHPDQAERMATGAGAWCARWRTLEVTGVRPYRLWSDPSRATAAAGRWLDRVGPQLSPTTAELLRGDVAALADVLGSAPAVLGHGDFNPANVLVDAQGRPICVIDVEFVRLTHPLFDPAWFRAALAIWSPAVWREVWATFWAAYRRETRRLELGDPQELEPTGESGPPGTDVGEILDRLGRLRLLEILEHTRTRPDAPLWRERMERLAAATQPGGP